MKTSANKTRKKISGWLCSVLSLSIVLGLTWIPGLFIVDWADQLLPIIYIYSILVAFQGVFILIVFVVLSRPVQDLVKKFCKAKFKRSSIESLRN